MSSYVLVHGGCHGAWCWERVTPLLVADPRVGEVVAVDLPGRGATPGEKPLAEITLEDCVEHLVEVVESRDLHDVILVGHSLAGITLPPAAHRLAPRLRRVVYLASSNPEPGQTIDDVFKLPLSCVQRGISMETIFCNDLDEKTTTWLMSQLVAEPPRLFETPVAVARLPAGIPSTYVLLERDESLPPVHQREQARTAGVDEVVSFDSGHSPFAAKPRELAELLLGWA